MRLTTLFVCLLALAAGTRTAAQPPASQPASSSASPAVDGPPPPVPPEVISRDGQGRATIRAVRIEEAIRVDGALDEEVYHLVPAIGDFIQQEPQEGAPATERTEAWVFFDDRNLYVSARCWDSHPERDVLDELRRDLTTIAYNENFVVTLDTFYDRRNGFFFQVTPLSAIRDLLLTDEGNPNTSWNTVWTVRSGKFDGGWTVEIAIPFKSLRYRGSGSQVWGINLRRAVRWKNEVAFATRVPIAYGVGGVFHLSASGTLVGLETPRQSMNLEIKPYVVTSLTTDRTAPTPTTNRIGKNAGFDFKYGLTRSLIADATYNTDFAQVEEDVQQVNLTRFSLFFPEKREFFLEGQGTFAFGGQTGSSAASDVPILFFSRQIGLSQGQSVPVLAGGRLTGKAGHWGIGALNVETDALPSAGAARTNFTAIRIKRDILRRSNVGLIATRRAPSGEGAGSNLAVGVDANLALFRNVSLISYFAKTQSDGLSGNDTSYRTRFDYAGDRYGLALEEMIVGENFNPKMGFVRRRAFARDFVQARFSPRPRHSALVRKFTWQGSFDHVTDAHRATLENREARATFITEFQNSDTLTLDHTRDFEFLQQDFPIASGVIVPAGGYEYHTTRATYDLGQQHKISGTLAVAGGTFYGGTRTEATYNGRVSVQPRFAFEPIVSLNWIELPYGTFSARLLSTRWIVTPTPRMSISSLVQFNASAHTLNSSVRLRWEYAGGSELFVVYSDGRNTLAPAAPELLTRSFAVKLTRLVRF